MVKRNEFLEKHWRAYPTLPSQSSQFVFGRIQKLNESQIEILAQGKTHAVIKKDLRETEDHHFGKSIPPDLLVQGDVVALELPNKGVFLLSPNQTGRNIMLDAHVLQWGEFLKKIENYFLKEEFLQARTPFLVACPGVDHHIDYLSVKGSRSGKSWYLPTSPEIHLKKLLCDGFEKVFEIKSCFRDDFEGNHHRIEFTMLEWYRGFESLESLIVDLENIFSITMNKVIKLKKVSVKEKFYETTGFSLTPQTTKEELLKLIQTLGIDFHISDDWNDLFFRIYMEKVEPNLGVNEPEIIFDFPAQQASLAQIDNNGWAKRFELYYKGVELANAYLELNDPKENRERFIKEKELRESSEKEASRFDEDFFKRLEQGMPPSSGIALGLDRLYMLACGRDRL